MKIEEIDKNFARGGATVRGGKAIYDIPDENFHLYGLFHDRVGFYRMDRALAAKIGDGVNYLNTNTAGGRLRFRTNSAYLGIEVAYGGLRAMSHMTILGSSGFTLTRGSGEGETLVRSLMPAPNDGSGFSAETVLSGKDEEYTLYFPLYNDVESLKVILDEGAAVSRGRGYRQDKPILYYGSSITQGGCASRPDTCYQALIARRLDADYINLGFSGNCKGEKEMAEYLSGIDASAFVFDYDHNAPTAAYLAETHYDFYRIYREKCPYTPVIFISAPNPHTLGEAEKRVRIIRATYEKAIESGDENVRFIDGATFFGEEGETGCTVDGCHPTDHGFYRMANVIYGVLKEFIGETRK